MRPRHLVLALALLVPGLPARAQGQDPIGRFSADLRGLMAGLPTSEGWTPALPAETTVPSRAFGVDGGAHVYFTRWGPATLGAGASVTLARGTATAVVPGTPDVVSRSSTVAPQLSFNFGHRLGWSYLSAGYGVARVQSESSAVADIPPAESDSGWAGALNFGGGARWFLTDHVGVGFDLRWHKLSSLDATASGVGAPRTTLFHLALGVSLQ